MRKTRRADAEFTAAGPARCAFRNPHADRTSERGRAIERRAILRETNARLAASASASDRASPLAAGATEGGACSARPWPASRKALASDSLCASPAASWEPSWLLSEPFESLRAESPLRVHGVSQGPAQRQISCEGGACGVCEVQFVTQPFTGGELNFGINLQKPVPFEPDRSFCLFCFV